MRRAFTLIEMSVVITVLMIIVALVAPNMVALQRSREIRDLEASMLRAPIEARNEARRSGAAVTLRMEEDALVMERVPADETEDATEVKRVELDELIEIDSAYKNGETIDRNEWEWTVHPDGSAQETGALVFREGEDLRSLILPRQGSAHWQKGEPEEQDEERWPAGEREQRA